MLHNVTHSILISWSLLRSFYQLADTDIDYKSGKHSQEQHPWWVLKQTLNQEQSNIKGHPILMTYMICCAKHKSVTHRSIVLSSIGRRGEKSAMRTSTIRLIQHLWNRVELQETVDTLLCSTIRPPHTYSHHVQFQLAAGISIWLNSLSYISARDLPIEAFLI